jgi:hypothetical protein
VDTVDLAVLCENKLILALYQTYANLRYIKIILGTVKLSLEVSGMSEDVPIGLAVAEKLFGLILIIIGAIIAYYSMNPPTGDISHFSGMFTAAGLVIVAVGIFLVIAKTK